MRRSGLGLVVVVVALAGSTGIAHAAFTGPGGAIHGCVTKRGAMTVIAFKSRCGRGLRSIIIGAQGRPGTSGNSAALSKLQNEVRSLQADNAALTGEIGSLQSSNATLSSEVSALKATFANVTRTGNTLVLSGMNVQLESGAGSTSASPNGLGNLIIGYNQSPGTQTGSNNLVIGDGNSFTSFGGLVAGSSNVISGPYATVTGGHFNLASDAYSSVVGGCENLSGSGSAPSGSCTTGGQAVLGGFENTASGLEASVSGGELGTASGGASSVAGGQFGVASGGGASISGGNGNDASGSFASILGGFGNSATTFEATVTGGETNVASGTAAAVLGGDGNIASGNCQAIPAAPGSC